MRGRPAIYLPGQLTWDETPDTQVILQSNADLTTLVRVAESLTPVTVDDPRIPTNNRSRTSAAFAVAGVLLLVSAGWILQKVRADSRHRPLR